MKDTIYRDDAVALVIKAIHGTDNKEIQNYLMDGLRKQMWSLPSAEAIGDLISREEVHKTLSLLATEGGTDAKMLLTDAHEFIDALPSADAVSREEYEETDGVITIEKQSVKEVGEIKHIVIHSPNYTRYFYNESMPISAEAVHKPDYSYEADMVRRLKEILSAEAVQGWIPCSERLPEKDELVLVTVWDSVSIAWRNIYGGWESAEDMYTKGDVTAWMPLPKPYREDGEV